MSEQPAFLLMHDYRPEAKAYWWTTFLLGTAVFGLSLVEVAKLSDAAVLQVLVGVAIAAVTGLFPVRIPGAKVSVAGAEIFVFMLLLIHGPAAAAIAAACEAAVGSWRTSDRWTSRLGSPAMAALAMYGCGSAFALAVPLLDTSGAGDRGPLFALLLLVALAYSAASTLLTGSLMCVKRGEPVRPVRLLRAHGWLALAYAASASVSGLVYMSFDRFGSEMLLAIFPIIAMFLSTLHFYFRQAETQVVAQREKFAAAEHAVAEAARHVVQLQASESRFHSAFTHAAVGMMLVSNEYRILQANPALCHLLGRSETELAQSDLKAIVHAEDVGVLQAQVAGLLSGADSKFTAEVRCLHRHGIDVWVSTNGSFFSAGDSGERCLIVQMHDVTARRRAESRLQHIAYHDGLTNLPNRSHFLEQLTRAIVQAAGDPAAMFAVLFLDFDRFKVINDSLGHRAGDELLTTAARRLRECLRPTDLVARLGGDEFAILVEHVRSDAEVMELAERIQGVLRAPIHLGEAEVTTSASIGITTSAFRYETPEQAMRDADIAMYRAKSQGKAQYALFDSALHTEVSSQLWMEGELRRAIEGGVVDVDFQPIFDLRSRRLTGFEALARWPHAARGSIRPSEFIALAEETGLIVPLGDRVLERACGQHAQLQRNIPGIGMLDLHVNVSGMQLSRPGYASRVKQIIAAFELHPEQVTLELTESVLIEKLSAALPNLLELREIGVRISIDDFGTGYSSLSVLQDLPIGEIKIDRTFVTRLANGGGDEVVRAIIALGRSLGKRVIAEGIESAPQLDQLIRLGCEHGQGFLLGRPMSTSDAEVMARTAATQVRIA